MFLVTFQYTPWVFFQQDYRAGTGIGCARRARCGLQSTNGSFSSLWIPVPYKTRIAITTLELLTVPVLAKNVVGAASKNGATVATARKLRREEISLPSPTFETCGKSPTRGGKNRGKTRHQSNHEVSLFSPLH
jgi:hypothetical protein